MLLFEGSLEVKLPTIWTDGKAEVGRIRGIEGARRKKMQVREKVGKLPNSGGSKGRLANPGCGIVSFLMLSTSKIEDVSQNCFVFDVVNFENWESLAELFRFWCCQFQKFRRSRKSVSFLTLSSSKNEKVSQTCFAFDFVKFKDWGFAELFSFVFDAVKFKKWGCFAELFWALPFKN